MSSYFLGNYKVFLVIMINLLQEKINYRDKTSIDNWNELLDIFRFIKRQFLMCPQNGRFSCALPIIRVLKLT